MAENLKIGKKLVGQGFPVYIIAEAGINHNGSVDCAKEMIRCAKNCGVDAIKFQIFKAAEFVSNSKDLYTYHSQGKPVTESMLEMFRRYEFTSDEWEEIFSFCKKQKIDFFATPQNPSDLDFLLTIVDVPVIKVGSDDLTNLELMAYYAKKGKPLIISAGMAYLGEIEDAVNVIRESGNPELAVLHCISSYPTEAGDIHLRKMLTLRQAFNVVTGFSDHTRGSVAAIGAVALGASIIEKHFTMDKNMAGPDHWFSSDPKELADLVHSIRYIERSMGNPQIRPTEKESDMRSLARRSIVASMAIKKGDTITRDSIDFKRPGTGLPPKYLPYIIGRKAKSWIRKNSQILFDNTC